MCVFVCMCAVMRNKYPHKGIRMRNSILASSHLQGTNLGPEFRILFKMSMTFGWEKVKMNRMETKLQVLNLN